MGQPDEVPCWAILVEVVKEVFCWVNEAVEILAEINGAICDNARRTRAVKLCLERIVRRSHCAGVLIPRAVSSPLPRPRELHKLQLASCAAQRELSLAYRSSHVIDAAFAWQLMRRGRVEGPGGVAVGARLGISVISQGSIVAASLGSGRRRGMAERYQEV